MIIIVNGMMLLVFNYFMLTCLKLLNLHSTVSSKVGTGYIIVLNSGVYIPSNSREKLFFIRE